MSETGAAQRQWKIRCLKCGKEGTSLVPMQEHLIEEHGVRQESFRDQVRQDLGNDHYQWTLDDGTEVMSAEPL